MRGEHAGPSGKGQNMKNPLDLPIINPYAAGVDVGTEKFFASVAGKEPKVFLTVTEGLKSVCQYFNVSGRIKVYHLGSLQSVPPWRELFNGLRVAFSSFVLFSAEQVRRHAS
jgi:hypothetical protein